MDCGEPLDVHQPEADSPSRLLGTCYDCGLWYLIDLPDAATGSLLLTKLPEADELKPEPPKAPSNTKSR